VSALALAAALAAAALWFDGPASRPLAGALAAAFALACVAIAVRVRPAARAALAVLVLLGAVTVWWLRIPPRNDRDWLPEVARPARATIDGDRVTIENVRDFRWRSETDFDERWETRSWDLGQLTGADVFFSQWDSPYILHTIVSWTFAGAPPLAISIETRKERGETYSAVRGFFRQFELYYVVADERDVIALRTGPRGERVRLHHVRMGAPEARAILLDYLREVNELAERPRWYNALTHNCTTTIRQHVRLAGRENAWSWKILLNGFLEELMYERGSIDTSLPFAELRARSDVTARAREAQDDPAFSARIREGLPGSAP
jgi:hypothetical protein